MIIKYLKPHIRGVFCLWDDNLLDYRLEQSKSGKKGINKYER